jgi:2-methylcitrate dehydratase PrpD
MHAAIDAAIALHKMPRLTIDDIDAVTIGLSQQSLDLVGWPEERKGNPRNVLEGQFSAHFGVAVGLRLGQMGWQDYATQLFDPDIRALMARTHVEHDHEVEAHFPAQVAGRLTVSTRAGQSFSEFAAVPKGEPENPLTQDDLRSKFNGLVTPYLGPDGATELFDWVLHLEEQPSVERYFELALPRTQLTR